MERDIHYAVLIQSQIAEMFQEDAENRIDPKDFEDEENAKAFFHALGNIVPCRIYNQLTGNENNILEFNHVANHLVFDFTKMENEEG